jgi:peptidoglycan/xylan/chitin deacetylase (PgdA/CDA1 family)
MDHALYPFAPLPGRGRLAWPGGAGVAFGIVVYIEAWESHPPPGAVRDPRFGDPFGTFCPEQRDWARRDYGLRIGFFRVAEALDRFGLKATLAAGTGALARAPGLLDEALARGWEVAAHGDFATRMISSAMTEDQEAAHIEAAAEALAARTGRRPEGWVGQDFGESARTPFLLARAGFRWLADWPNDDRPYGMATVPPIVSVPVQADLDDVQLLWHRRVATPAYPGLVAEAAGVLADEAAAGGEGRSLVLGLHPWLIGMPHRIRYLHAALSRLAALPGLWHAPLGQIAAHYRAQGEGRP